MAKPKAIFITRHGESEGNVDETVYLRKADRDIFLTEQGVSEAKAMGLLLKDKLLGNKSLRSYISSYNRAQMTANEALYSIVGSGPITYSVRVDPRLREQEIPSATREEQLIMWKMREEHGRFYYRPNGGESGADVFNRVSDFISTLHRDFEKSDFPDNVILFTHGITARIFLMRWFHFSAEEFESLGNLRNCEILEMRLRDDGHYELITPLRLSPYVRPERIPFFNMPNPMFKVLAVEPIESHKKFDY